MRPREHRTPVRRLSSVIAGIGLLVIGGCSGQDDAASLAASLREPASGSVRVKKLPRLASAPEAPRLMQLYFDTTNGREWIYDGARWVPHDSTVDSFYKELASKGPEGTLRPAQPGTALTVPFSPTGAHTKHRAYVCTACHLVGGSPCLDPAGAAAAPGQAAPSFDATAKTCSSVACHGAYSGTYTYARWDWGIEDFAYVTVPYAGGGGAANGWYTTGSSCTSCHRNPPASTGPWHSPTHGMTVTAARKCETCHPDAVSAVVNGVTVGVSINATYAAVHADGTVNVQAKFSSKCFGCH